MASAQPPEPLSTERFRGVFGGGMRESSQSLTVTGSAGGGIDSDPYAALPDETVPGEPQRPGRLGTSAFGSGSAAYSMVTKGITFGATGGTHAYLYDGNRVMRSYGASANQHVALSSRTWLNASEFISYQPFHLNSLFPTVDSSFGAPPPPPIDTGITSATQTSWGADLGFSRRMTRRVDLYAGYGTQSSTWSGSGLQGMHHGRGGISIALGRGLNARMGYGYNQAGYSDPDGTHRVGNHTIDAGVDFSRSLSVSRRTTLSFSTGSTAVRERQITHFRVTGNADLARAIGRTWRIGVGYTRDVNYVTQLQDVMFSDGITGSIGGLLNRRQSFHAGVGLSSGTVGFAAGDNGAFVTYAYAGLATAVSRYIAVGTDYSYYYQSFGADVELPIGVLSGIDRHSIRAYVSLWAPILGSTRRLNATR